MVEPIKRKRNERSNDQTLDGFEILFYFCALILSLSKWWMIEVGVFDG